MNNRAKTGPVIRNSLEVLFNIADALKVEPGDLLNTSMIPDQILNKKEKQMAMGQKAHSHLFLVLRYPVTKNFVVTCAVLVYSATIAGVTLNSINGAVFDLLDNASVVG